MAALSSISMSSSYFLSFISSLLFSSYTLSPIHYTLLFVPERFESMNLSGADGREDARDQSEHKDKHRD
jgi:hypothetical protein